MRFSHELTEKGRVNNVKAMMLSEKHTRKRGHEVNFAA